MDDFSLFTDIENIDVTLVNSSLREAYSYTSTDNRTVAIEGNASKDILTIAKRLNKTLRGLLGEENTVWIPTSEVPAPTYDNLEEIFDGMPNTDPDKFTVISGSYLGFILANFIIKGLPISLLHNYLIEEASDKIGEPIRTVILYANPEEELRNRGYGESQPEWNEMVTYFKALGQVWRHLSAEDPDKYTFIETAAGDENALYQSVFGKILKVLPETPTAPASS